MAFVLLAEDWSFSWRTQRDVLNLLAGKIVRRFWRNHSQARRPENRPPDRDRISGVLKIAKQAWHDVART
jgi:hypothetical protein